jgi:hypothetical protein
VASTTPSFYNHYGALNLILLEKAQILQQQGQSFAQLQPVAGEIGEEESALSSSESSLDSSAARRAFSILI